MNIVLKVYINGSFYPVTIESIDGTPITQDRLTAAAETILREGLKIEVGDSIRHYPPHAIEAIDTPVL